MKNKYYERYKKSKSYAVANKRYKKKMTFMRIDKELLNELNKINLSPLEPYYKIIIRLLKKHKKEMMQDIEYVKQGYYIQ